jgi:hypothetical protein
MTRQREKFTGCLLKKIDLDETPALGLRRSLGLPPNKEDIVAHIQSELAARWLAIDKQFGLDSTAADIMERRGEAANRARYRHRCH